MDLMLMQREQTAREMKMTVLHRPNGVWHLIEVGRLVNGLMTEVSQHPEYPEYLVIYGHHTKEKTLEVMLGGIAYTATQITGMESRKLPFIPGFM